jgi:hypothetical protein
VWRRTDISVTEFLSARRKKRRKKRRKNRQSRGRAVHATGYFDTENASRNPIGLEYSYCKHYHQKIYRIQNTITRDSY